MIDGKKVVVVFPAYNAAKTLEKTFKELPFDIVDETILVDDASKDGTAALAKRIGVNHVIVHDNNRGYGGNQKSCYNKAIEVGADIVIMVHPDYQYTPLLVMECIGSLDAPLLLCRHLLLWLYCSSFFGCRHIPDCYRALLRGLLLCV